MPHVLLLLRRVARSTGCALLVSTHDLELALKTADRLWVVKADGTFVEGTPGELSDAGAFDDMFPSEQISFDRARRQFTLRDAAL